LFVSVPEAQNNFFAKRLAEQLQAMGSFGFLVKPHGILTPQMPAKLHEIVKMSLKYICNGSSDFPPIWNAAVGEVGVTMASTFQTPLKNHCE